MFIPLSMSQWVGLKSEGSLVILQLRGVGAVRLSEWRHCESTASRYLRRASNVCVIERCSLIVWTVQVVVVLVVEVFDFLALLPSLNRRVG